jgi:hypothetical protein
VIISKKECVTFDLSVLFVAPNQNILAKIEKLCGENRFVKYLWGDIEVIYVVTYSRLSLNNINT